VTLRDRLRRLLPFLSNEGLLILLVGLTAFRAILVDLRLRPLSECRGCLALPTAQHDGEVLGVVLLIFALAQIARSAPIRAGLRAIVCAVILGYGLDLLILYLYNIRLVVADFFKYGREVGGVVTIARHLIQTPAGIANLIVILVVTGLMVVFVRSTARLGRTSVRAFATAGLALLVIGVLPGQAQFVHAWAYRNVFEINFDRDVSAVYSDEFAAALRARHHDLRLGPSCSTRAPVRPDVLMVVLEGFSMYHSRFFSGLGDQTPNLDRIAARHTAYTRFFANGFTTENGLIALLAGQVPTPAPGPVAFGGGFAFDGFFDLPRSLPRLFETHGYRTSFLTTGDLSFSGKGDWLSELGFHERAGHDDPFYDGWPRMHFRAAPDSALYLRALRWLEETPRDRPFFLVLETVSSHHPFIEPATRRKSEPAVFRYADRQLGLFYDALAERGLLDSLLLIVVSDHRTMTPVRPEEVARFGDDAPSLVPLVIANPAQSGPRRIDSRFQQVDFATSVEAMLTGRSCPATVRGDLLADPPVPPACVFHARVDDRGKVDVVCGADRAAVRLGGDATRIESGAVPDAQGLLDQISLERLERRDAHKRSRR
jgi:phosphoglycerol transferase MdoB-like AlkP superfamily enzyme